MTIKYLWIIANYSDGKFSKWYNEYYKQYENSFHIPIDNCILQYFYENNILKEAFSIKVVEKNKYYRILENEKEYSWSNIPSYKSYFGIINEVRKSIVNESPLEWENDAWLKIIEKRVEDNNKSKRNDKL